MADGEVEGKELSQLADFDDQLERASRAARAFLPTGLRAERRASTPVLT